MLMRMAAAALVSQDPRDHPAQPVQVDHLAPLAPLVRPAPLVLLDLQARRGPGVDPQGRQVQPDLLDLPADLLESLDLLDQPAQVEQRAQPVLPVRPAPRDQLVRPA